MNSTSGIVNSRLNSDDMTLCSSELFIFPATVSSSPTIWPPWAHNPSPHQDLQDFTRFLYLRYSKQPTELGGHDTVFIRTLHLPGHGQFVSHNLHIQIFRFVILNVYLHFKYFVIVLQLQIKCFAWINYFTTVQGFSMIFWWKNPVGTGSFKQHLFNMFNIVCQCCLNINFWSY